MPALNQPETSTGNSFAAQGGTASTATAGGDTSQSGKFNFGQASSAASTSKSGGGGGGGGSGGGGGGGGAGGGYDIGASLSSTDQQQQALDATLNQRNQAGGFAGASVGQFTVFDRSHGRTGAQTGSSTATPQGVGGDITPSLPAGKLGLVAAVLGILAALVYLLKKGRA